jgi:threonine synthase
VLSAIRSGLSKWDEKALPAIKAQWSRLTRSRKAESRQTVVSEVQAIAAAMPVADSPDVTSALAVYQASMSSTEARERFVAALVARAFSDEQMRILRETPVRAGDALDLGHLMEAVTPEEVARHINQVLQSNPTLLEARTGAGFGHLEEPLRLTDGKK